MLWKSDLCGREAPLEAHHKISLHKDMTKALDINNGQALCHSCHLKADGRKERVCQRVKLNGATAHGIP